jgi:hypothetical protein
MPKTQKTRKAPGLTTLRKNIERESHAYFLKHKTHKFIARLAELDNRSAGAFIDVLVEDAARSRLSATEFKQLAAAGDQIEETRRQEAAAQEEELREKREARKTSQAAS